MTDGDDVERVGRCGDERGPHYLGITVASSLPSLFEYYTDEFLRMQPRFWPAVVRGQFPEADEPMPDPPPETQSEQQQGTHTRMYRRSIHTCCFAVCLIACAA